MHLTDEQLNEYLDQATNQAAQIEAHLAACPDCAARLADLQTLFAELEALPELPVARDFSAPYQRSVSQLPRWLTLTSALQAAGALLAMALAAPLVSSYLAQFLPADSAVSFQQLWLDLQLSLLSGLDRFHSLQLPALPTVLISLPSGWSGSRLVMAAIALFVAWAFGNWWLILRRPHAPA